jgi:hypothetical protein
VASVLTAISPRCDRNSNDRDRNTHEFDASPAGAVVADLVGAAAHSGDSAEIKPGYGPRLTNTDLAPLRDHHWSSYNVFAFWMSDGPNKLPKRPKPAFEPPGWWNRAWAGATCAASMFVNVGYMLVVARR